MSGDVGVAVGDRPTGVAAAFPEVPRTVIENIVTASWAELAGLPLRDVMSLLAERTAREAIRRRQASGR